MSADRDYWLEGRSNYLDGICPQAGRPLAGHPLSVQFGHGLNDLKAWDSKVQGPGWLGALGNGDGVQGPGGWGPGAMTWGCRDSGVGARGQDHVWGLATRA